MTRARAWGWMTAAALIAASNWLKSPSVEYLAPLALATLGSVLAVLSIRHTKHVWATLSSVALMAVAVVAIPTQLKLASIARDWNAWQSAASRTGLDQLREALDGAVHDAATAATAAVRAPSYSERAGAFQLLSGMVGGGYERGVVLFQHDSARAWAGTIRVSVDSAPSGLDVVNSSVYLALRATTEAGDRRATAVALIDAVPPGDRLAPTLASRIALDAELAGFNFMQPTSVPADSGVLRYAVNGVTLFDVQAVAAARGAVEQRLAERARVWGGIALGIALFAFVVGVWRRSRLIGLRIAALAVALVCVALAPLNELSNRSRLFDATVYSADVGRQFTDNAGALAITSAIALLGVIAVIRRRGRPAPRWAAVATVVLVAGLGLFLLSDLARGIAIPPRGVDVALWLIWEVPVFLAAVSVLLAGAAAGAAIMGRRRGIHPAVAPGLAAVAAFMAPIVWNAPGQWPGWYTALWIAAIATLALSRQTRFMIAAASTVGALGAATLVWGQTARGRVDLAERDLSGLNAVDMGTPALLRQFARDLEADPAPRTRQELLEEYVRSNLEAANHPVAIFAWPTNDGPADSLRTASFPLPDVRALVAHARATGLAVVDTVPTNEAMVTVLAAPGTNGGVTAVVVAPSNQLFAPDSAARLFGLDVGLGTEPPYTVQLRQAAPASAAEDAAVWRRDADVLHGDRVVRTGSGVWRMHVEVDIRPLDVLVERGTLIVFLDLAIVAVLWLAGVVADGAVGRWLIARQRRWARSFRVRLTLALFAFFVIPAGIFAIWTYHQVAEDARQSREVRIRQTLRSVAMPTPPLPGWISHESDLVRTPLLLYQGGELRQTSDPLLDAFAPFGRFLDPSVEIPLEELDEGIASAFERLGDSHVLVGFRPGNERTVLAAPATADDPLLGRRHRDLGVLVLFATLIGAVGAFWLSGIAARQLARPIGTLREAALSIASGDRLPPLEGEPTVEFRPVFTAFRRMAADLNASRSALEDAQRRTAAVLRNVASGVIAVGPDATIALANPRASAILAAELPPGRPLGDAVSDALATLVLRFLTLSGAPEEEVFEVEIDTRQLHGRITRLERGGAVITIDDVTELARAQRVLAWGEMARQVAHEIKNPLTPIRLGVQHLKRARADGRVDFDRVLDQNVSRILTEIDRLDEIARAFSKYGSEPDARRPVRPTDVAAVVRDVVALERMGVGDGVRWEVRGADDPVEALATDDELKEVLLNLLENARLAQSRSVMVDVARSDPKPAGAGESVSPTAAGGEPWVRIVVRDDGRGIPGEVMPRIFEPHFSTRTSGSGLGLAISRQIIDGWGGEIGVESVAGSGTTVSLRLRAAHSAAPPPQSGGSRPGTERDTSANAS